MNNEVNLLQMENEPRLIEEEEEMSEPRVQKRISLTCKVYMTNFDKKSPQRVRFFELPQHYTMMELKYKISELYSRTFHGNLQSKKGVELLFKDVENELVLFDSEEEWQHIKKVRMEVGTIKIHVDMDRNAASKVCFIPKSIKPKQPAQVYAAPSPARSMISQPLMNTQPQVIPINVNNNPYLQQQPQQPRQNSVLYPVSGGSQQPQVSYDMRDIGLTEDRVEKILNKLYEMGFTNRQRNLECIRIFRGDLNKIMSSGQLDPSTH